MSRRRGGAGSSMSRVEGPAVKGLGSEYKHSGNEVSRTFDLGYHIACRDH